MCSKVIFLAERKVMRQIKKNGTECMHVMMVCGIIKAMITVLCLECHAQYHPAYSFDTSNKESYKYQK